MKIKRDKKGLLGNKRGVSIAFSIFVIFVVIIVFAMINMALSGLIQETVKFTNTYNEDNPEKYMDEVHTNQNSAYLFYDNFVIILLLTLASWAIVNSIRRGWQETGGE